MRKCANIYSYMRKPLVMYKFALSPFKISLSFFTVCNIEIKIRLLTLYTYIKLPSILPQGCDFCRKLFKNVYSSVLQTRLRYEPNIKG